ncbi:MAG: hypothetical protein KJ064_15325 [Anaerolineae bacterium]|nr:hypothetical protein [Anaerolineae bacterium]
MSKPFTEAEYIAYLKAKAARKALQEADLIQPEDSAQESAAEETPPFCIGFLPHPPAWSADDLEKYEALANGGTWENSSGKI